MKLISPTNSTANIKAVGAIDIKTDAEANIEAMSTANVKSTGPLSVESTASIDLKAPAINLVTGALSMASSGGGASAMTMSGNINLDGAISTSGSIISNGINLTTHTHTVSGSSTGGPR